MKIAKTAVILAGGKSSRMGYSNKALLNLKEKKFIKIIIEALDSYEEIIIISNNIDEYKDLGVKVIKDIYKGHGPMSGIHSALIHSKYDECLCIACDMPLINKTIVNYLGLIEDNYDILIPKFNDRYEPLCAIYHKNITELMEEKIKVNENKLMKFCMEVNYKVVEEFPNEISLDKLSSNFININTPEEYFKLLKDN